MKVSSSSITAFEFGETTIIAVFGKQTQQYLFEGITPKSINLDPALEEKVTMLENTLVINKATVIIASFETRTSTLTIVEMQTSDFSILMAKAALDPDVKSLLDSINAIGEKLPNKGHLNTLMDNLGKVDWREMLAEVSNAVRIARPQIWAKIEELLPKELSEWLASKLKIS